MRFILYLLLALPALVRADTESDFRMAREAYSRGNSARLDKVAASLKDTVLEPYVTYYQLRLGGQGMEQIRDFLSRDEESPVVDLYRNDLLRYLGKHGRWDAFDAEYPRLITPEDETVCYLLQSRQRSDQAGALASARAFWFRGDESPEGCNILFADALKQGVITTDDVWQRMRLALENGNTTLARQLIKQLPKEQQFSTAELTMAARYPRSYLDKTKFDGASKGRRTAAMFALLRLSRQSPQLAYTNWERIGVHFPEEEQRYFFGWLGYAAALDHDERALAWFSAAGDATLNPRQFAWRTRAALRIQDWHEVWESIASMQPAQQAEGVWRYWKARALAALGRPAEADAIYLVLSREYNFYGQLAAEELGAGPGAGIVSASFQPAESEIEAVQALPAIQRTLLLYRMDLRNEAAREWAWATRKFSDRQLLAAAEVAKRNEMYDRSINAADRTVSLHDFNLRYPAPYREALQENLQVHGLEEAWVYGLMRQESRFTKSAKSDAGAAGVMQLMPSTARWAATRMGMKGYRKGLIHQLDVNLKLGTYYMKTVYSQFDENPVLASAAYNAGPNRAREWRGPQPLEGAIYIETIPFDETRDYVKKVMSNTIYYSKLFGQPKQSLKQRLGTIEAAEEKKVKVQRD